MTTKNTGPGRRGPVARPAEPERTAEGRGSADPISTEAASTFDLELIAPVQGGQMLARLDGQVTFVSGGIPGEVVQAYVPMRKRGYLEAVAVAIERRSGDRVPPPCPYFGENVRRRGAIDEANGNTDPVCGGCQYQHISYERQLALKTDVVRDVLRRVGKILEAPVAASFPSPASYHYRNKASWLVTAEGELAYREAHSHTPVPIASCHLLIPSVHAILQSVQAASADIGLGGLALGLEARMLPDSAGEEHGTLVIELAPSTTREEAHALAEAMLEICPQIVGIAAAGGHEAEPFVLAGEARLQVAFLDEVLTVSATTFFQVNLPVATAMARYVLEQCGTLDGREVLDVYSGAGALTIPLARRSDAVIAIELDAGAVADARDSIARAGLENVTLLQGDAAANLRSLLPGTIACAVVDPPRAGLAPEALRQLARIKAPRLVYVSCDAATLARDLRVLLDQGYELERVQPFDLFPQTAHIENVATLKLPRKFRARPR